jgi:RimJ/RimL family protein N-acetyltransferase
MNTIRKLSPLELYRYSDHLLRLNSDDRYLRFGSQVDDSAIIRHVNSKSKDKKIILAAFDDNLNVIAACEVAFLLNKNSIFADTAEIGLSVESSHRNKGLGTDLFERALIVARNRRVKVFTSYCLTRNGFMMRIAKAHGMKIITEYGSSEASLELELYDATTVFAEMLGEGMAIADATTKMFTIMWWNNR